MHRKNIIKDIFFILIILLSILFTSITFFRKDTQTFGVTILKVSSNSMVPTFKKGDLIFRLSFPSKIILVDEKTEGLLINNLYCIIRCNNKKAIRVKLALPNDDNYDLNPNIAYIYVYDDGQIYNQLKINQAIGINGHIESKWGQKIIVDVLSFIKEPTNC